MHDERAMILNMLGEGKISIEEAETGSAHLAAGTINRGGTELSVSSVSGDISVQSVG